MPNTIPNPNHPPLRIAISGASGLVGSRLTDLLQKNGHHVDRLVRGKTDQNDEIAIWEETFDESKLDGLNAVIHLAGKPIADKRWTDEVKEQIRDSRIEKTRLLCRRLAAMKTPKPATLLCASASGFYGEGGEQSLTEESPAGEGFLATVGKEWEEACQPAVEAGIRVVHLRFGILLSPAGGALEKMLLPARLCGGRLGSGRQWWSWLAMDDALAAIAHCLFNDEIHGPVNFVSPNPVRNAEFAETLGKVLGRPAIFPAPAFALRIALGEMADALLLNSQKIVPKKLQATGYSFLYPELEPALRHLLNR